MALNRRTAIIISLGILGLAGFLYMLSNGLASWGSAGGIVTVGLWKTCGSSPFGDICLSIPCGDPPLEGTSLCGKMQAARAFMTLSCLISVVSVLCLLVGLFRSEYLSPGLLRMAKLIPIISLVTGILGVAIGIAFITDTLNNGLSLSTAAFIGIIAIVLNLVGAITTVLISTP